MADNQVDLKLNLDFQGVNDALYQMIGQFNGTDKEFQKIANNIQKNAKSLEAAIKLFGPASQQAGAAANKLQKDFQSLVANGIDPASSSFKKMTASMPTSAGLDSTTGSLRKGNQQWANLALVLQDLPYGFRGIQNNLPALAGGFAKMTGPIYLGISAIIALITAWDMGLFKLNKNVTLSSDYSKEAGENYAKESVKLNGLINVSKNANIALNERIKAAKTLKEEYPGLLDKYSEEEIMLGKADIAFKKLTTTLWAYAKAKAAQSTLEEIAAKQNKLLVERADLLDEFNKKNIKSFKDEATYTEDGIRLMSEYDKEVIRRIDLLKKNATAYNDLEKQAGRYVKIQEANINAEKDLNDFTTDTNAPKEKINTSALDNLKTQQKIYKDDLDMFFYYGSLIINEEERIAKERARIEGTLGKDLVNIEANYEGQRIINKQEFGRKLMEQADKNTKTVEKGEKESQDKILENTKSYYENRKKYAFDNLEELKVIFTQELAGYKFLLDLKIIDDIAYANKAAEIYKALGVIKNKEDQNLYKSQVYFSNQRIKNIEQRLATELKINKNNIGAQQESIKKAMAEVGALAYFALNPEALQQFLEFFNQLNGKLQGTTDKWQSFSQGISNSISGFLADSFTALAENLGNALSGGEIKPLEHFQKLLADALINIGKMLIQFGTLQAIAFASPNPFVAIAAGTAAVALGTIIKNRFKQSAVDPTAFANGGIVSGPTMGLMGEYPGAQNNPEVIAPLDKLKDMLGGGNGQFVLRGQDLVLAMQRSNTSLNIRRG
jgi:hypothetical protein